MKVGITGTRKGATGPQLGNLIETLRDIDATELHHGDCIGVDSEAHAIARGLGLKIVLHPPTIDDQRAGCSGDEEREPKPYLVRNHDIVNETDLLIALPGELMEQRRGSGTWATVRYARKLRRPVLIITPAGVSV